MKPPTQQPHTPLRPATLCRQLLNALDASERRRKCRKRNTTPNAIGLAIKRDLLEQTVREDPAPEAFQGWLLERCLSAGAASGPLRTMAMEILAEWRLAEASRTFRDWLAQGAPSDDAQQHQ